MFKTVRLSSSRIIIFHIPIQVRLASHQSFNAILIVYLQQWRAASARPAALEAGEGSRGGGGMDNYMELHHVFDWRGEECNVSHLAIVLVWKGKYELEVETSELDKAPNTPDKLAAGCDGTRPHSLLRPPGLESI